MIPTTRHDDQDRLDRPPAEPEEPLVLWFLLLAAIVMCIMAAALLVTAFA